MTRTLLLADDSVTIQRVIELTFADEDVQVVAVGDGDQAIARLEERPPDIVLADIAMPGKNGYEVASYIKHSEHLAHIPVLLLTGAFEPVDQRRVAEVRCDGVLAKPFEPQFVIGRVKELLGMDHDGDAKAITTAPTVAIPRGEIGPAASDSGGTSSTSLNDYLDRLDNALANLPVGGSGASAAAKAPAPVVDHRPPVENEWDISLGEGSDASQASSSVATAVAPAVRAVPTLLARSSGPALPALAEAFAALLAAEHGASPAAPAAWPAPAAAPIGDDVVNRVVERVLGQMSDRIVRETVTEIVSKIAERLVREEIERLKASIS